MCGRAQTRGNKFIHENSTGNPTSPWIENPTLQLHQKSTHTTQKPNLTNFPEQKASKPNRPKQSLPMINPTILMRKPLVQITKNEAKLHKFAEKKNENVRAQTSDRWREFREEQEEKTERGKERWVLIVQQMTIGHNEGTIPLNSPKLRTQTQLKNGGCIPAHLRRRSPFKFLYLLICLSNVSLPPLDLGGPPNLGPRKWNPLTIELILISSN